MSDPKKTPSSIDPPRPVGAEPMPSRRRLLQGGMAAAPVLMTLASRPVLAATCQSPSGYVSANASNAGRAVACLGHIPSWWADPQNFGQWPAGYKPQSSTRFGGLQGYKPESPPTRFGGPQGVFSISPYNAGTTLLEVVSGQINSGNPTTDKIARLIVATLLNTAAGLVPVLSVAAVKDMWNEFARSGYLTYSPSSGASWNAVELIDYLSTTM